MRASRLMLWARLAIAAAAEACAVRLGALQMPQNTPHADRMRVLADFARQAASERVDVAVTPDCWLPTSVNGSAISELAASHSVALIVSSCTDASSLLRLADSQGNTAVEYPRRKDSADTPTSDVGGAPVVSIATAGCAGGASWCLDIWRLGANKNFKTPP